MKWIIAAILPDSDKLLLCWLPEDKRVVLARYRGAFYEEYGEREIRLSDTEVAYWTYIPSVPEEGRKG